jgi:sugar phosphate isomerase/epimerase
MAKQGFSRPLGLQLYSLRREASKDLASTLSLIRELGFRELEVGSFFGHTASDFRQVLTRYELKATSMGADWRQLSTAVKKVADDAAALGVEYVTTFPDPQKEAADT